jgi:hypothetical protein
VTTQIETVPYEGICSRFLSQIHTWVNEVSERADLTSTPPYLLLTIWKNNKDLQDFYRQEKEALGILTGEESGFLATHEAWRGFPRIHICHERVRGVPDPVIRGVLHHEIGHALIHGSMEFYTFRFSHRLQEMARFKGLDLHHLQQCVYYLSVAIKDREVVQWLTEIGLGSDQKSLLEYMVKDTKEERQVWVVAQRSPGIKKTAMAAFLKVILPIEAMLSIGFEDARSLKDQWEEAYNWLSVIERDGLLRLSQKIMNFGGARFQEKLENAAYGLIEESFERMDAVDNSLSQTF